MPSRVGFSGQHLTLERILDHYRDLEASLRTYFTDTHPGFAIRFFGYTAEQIAAELDERIVEVDTTSALMVLSALEAAFRIDYLQRCYLRRKDELSRAFRALHKKRGSRVSLEDDILEMWNLHSTGTRRIIGDVRRALRYRHWLAHGRYWVSRLGQKYDFDSIYTLTDEVLRSFPLEGMRKRGA